MVQYNLEQVFYNDVQSHKLFQGRIMVVVIERKDFLRKHEDVVIKMKWYYINNKKNPLKRKIKVFRQTYVINIR